MINATTVGRKVEITRLLEQNGAVNGICSAHKLAHPEPPDRRMPGEKCEQTVDDFGCAVNEER